MKVVGEVLKEFQAGVDSTKKEMVGNQSSRLELLPACIKNLTESIKTHLLVALCVIQPNKPNTNGKESVTRNPGPPATGVGPRVRVRGACSGLDLAADTAGVVVRVAIDS